MIERRPRRRPRRSRGGNCAAASSRLVRSRYLSQSCRQLARDPKAGIGVLADSGRAPSSEAMAGEPEESRPHVVRASVRSHSAGGNEPGGLSSLRIAIARVEVSWVRSTRPDSPGLRPGARGRTRLRPPGRRQRDQHQISSVGGKGALAFLATRRTCSMGKPPRPVNGRKAASAATADAGRPLGQHA